MIIEEVSELEHWPVLRVNDARGALDGYRLSPNLLITK